MFVSNMSVELTTQDVTQLVELFILFSKKNAFSIDEYGDVFTMYSKLKEFIMKVQSNQDTSSKCSLEQKELAYLIKVMEVCSQRTPVEVQNYKAISNLFDRLNGMVVKEKEEGLSDIEEVKEEEE